MTPKEQAMTPKIQTRMMTFPTKPLITVPAARMPGSIRVGNKAVERDVAVGGMTTAAAAEAAVMDLVEGTVVGVRTAKKRRAVADGIPPQLPVSKKSLLLKSHHLTRG